MAEPRPRTYYTTMLKERHRAERAEEHAAAFKRRWADERARAEASEAEVRALREALAAVRAAADDFAGAGSRVTYSGMDVAMVFESLLDPPPECATCGGTRKVYRDITRIVGRRPIPDTVKMRCPDCATADPTPDLLDVAVPGLPGATADPTPEPETP